MFRRFDSLLRKLGADDKSLLANAWTSLVRTTMAQPWDGRSLDHGHVPYPDIAAAFTTLSESFDQKGLYVWGAWNRDAARVQYIGISGVLGNAPTLRKRFRSRYVRVDRSGGLKTSGSRELAIAASYPALCGLADDYSPLRRIDVRKYRAAGIPVSASTNRHRRLTRAERYAKCGLPNVWFYLLPAHPSTTKAELKGLEKELVLLSNAELFRLHRDRQQNGIPLLNISHATQDNPRVISWVASRVPKVARRELVAEVVQLSYPLT